MIHRNRNFSNTGLAKYLAQNTVSNGDTFERCNLSRFKEESLFTGITGLTFRNCNLVNCLLPPDAVIENCLHIRKSFCTHKLDAKEIVHGLTPCAENCSHVVDTDVIEVDGVVLLTKYHYKHTLL